MRTLILNLGLQVKGKRACFSRVALRGWKLKWVAVFSTWPTDLQIKSPASYKVNAYLRPSDLKRIDESMTRVEWVNWIPSRRRKRTPKRNELTRHDVGNSNFNISTPLSSCLLYTIHLLQRACSYSISVHKRLYHRFHIVKIWKTVRQEGRILVYTKKTISFRFPQRIALYFKDK